MRVLDTYAINSYTCAIFSAWSFSSSRSKIIFCHNGFII